MYSIVMFGKQKKTRDKFNIAPDEIKTKRSRGNPTACKRGTFRAKRLA